MAEWTGPDLSGLPEEMLGYYVDKRTLRQAIFDTPGVARETRDVVIAAVDKDWGRSDYVDGYHLSAVIMARLGQELMDIAGYRAILARVTDPDLVPIVVSPQDIAHRS